MLILLQKIKLGETNGKQINQLSLIYNWGYCSCGTRIADYTNRKDSIK